MPSSKLGKENLLRVYKTFVERGLINKRVQQSHVYVKDKLAYINDKYKLVPITLKGQTRDQFRRKYNLTASDIHSPSKRKRGVVDKAWKDSPNPDQSVLLDPQKESSDSDSSSESLSLIGSFIEDAYNDIVAGG